MWARRTLPILAVALAVAAGPAAAQVLATRLVVEEQDPPDGYELHDDSGALVEITYSFLVRVPPTSFCTGPIDVEFLPGELPTGMTLLVAPDRVRLNYPQAQPNVAEARISGLDATARLFADASTPTTPQIPVIVQARAVASPMEASGASCNIQASEWTPSTFYFDYQAPVPVATAQEPEAGLMEAEPRLPPFASAAATNSPAPLRALPFLVLIGLAAGLPAALVLARRRRAASPTAMGGPMRAPRIVEAVQQRLLEWLADRGLADDEPDMDGTADEPTVADSAAPRPVPASQ